MGQSWNVILLWVFSFISSNVNRLKKAQQYTWARHFFRMDFVRLIKVESYEDEWKFHLMKYFWWIIHLDSSFCETNFASQFFPGKDIWIVSLCENCFQLLELLKWKSCSVPSLFSSKEGFIMHVRWVTQCWVWKIIS